ncbi:uncharacterized protein ATNIH1004_000450 [Aspergillus tanneri]|nr:uncharacterized protein ATNIH1004_000450 [Aspergillus tanneri]KAA8651560.1 hypothetical protein ATNIH1004_000450 [Aspergillus tanneri]
MRVRKSVTEGYKTHAAKAEEKFIFPSQETKPVRHSSSAWAELAPFCGISKTGGSAIQPHHMPSDGMMDSNKLATDDGDTFSLPPSSQESATSFSTLPTVQKRSYDSDYADESDGGCDGFLTPSTNNWLSVMGGTHTAGVGSVVGRTILSPKLGQERRQFVAMHRHKTMDIDDFEEPLFLRRREEVDMDYVASRESDYETEMVVSKSFYSE